MRHLSLFCWQLSPSEKKTVWVSVHPWLLAALHLPSPGLQAPLWPGSCWRTPKPAVAPLVKHHGRWFTWIQLRPWVVYAFFLLPVIKILAHTCTALWHTTCHNRKIRIESSPRYLCLGVCSLLVGPFSVLAVKATVMNSAFMFWPYTSLQTHTERHGYRATLSIATNSSVGVSSPSFRSIPMVSSSLVIEYQDFVVESISGGNLRRELSCMSMSTCSGWSGSRWPGHHHPAPKNSCYPKSHGE